MYVSIDHLYAVTYQTSFKSFAENRLASLNPTSIHLRVDKPALRIQDLDKDEAKTIISSLATWHDEMADVKLDPHPDTPSNLPPIRSIREAKIHVTSTPSATPSSLSAASQSGAQKSARIPGHDFRAWDKFDVDAALNEVDGEENTSNKTQNNPSTRSSKTAGDSAASTVRTAPKNLPPPIIANIPKSEKVLMAY